MTRKINYKRYEGRKYEDFIKVAKSFGDAAMEHFKKMIDHKSVVSYSGDIYVKSDIDKLNKHFIRFVTWVNNIISS